MQFGKLKRIMADVMANLSCAFCREKFHGQSAEIRMAEGNNIRFRVKCPKCSRQADVQVQISKKRFNKIGITSDRKTETKRVSPVAVTKISETVKNFRGKDVRELFS